MVQAAVSYNLCKKKTARICLYKTYKKLTIFLKETEAGGQGWVGRFIFHLDPFFTVRKYYLLKITFFTV